MKKGLIIGIVCVGVLLLAILAYGLYNASVIKSYAKEIDSIIKESNKKWTSKKIEEKSAYTTELESLLKTVKSDSESQLKKLKSLKAPKKAKNLEDKTKEYFTIAKNTSDKMLNALDYSEVLQKTANSLSSIGGSANSFEEMVEIFDNANKILTREINNLNKVKPPASFKDFHAKYLKVLKDMNSVVVEMKGYAEKKQVNKIEEANKRLEKVAEEAGRIRIPNEDELTKEIISKDDEEKLGRYPSEIEKEAEKLKKIVFSF